MARKKNHFPRGPYCSLNKKFNSTQLKESISHNLLSFLGRDPQRGGNRDLYKSLAYTLRDQLIEKWIQTQKNYYDQRQKRLYYLSMEFLVGRSLGNALINCPNLNHQLCW